MSRCFPFPPPGYERKTKADDIDLLKKEKHKDKKHKKEKKDKEKKDGKEKREKERSDEKHREKKDKKEKHRDKRKDKEKDRDKDRHKSDVFPFVEKKVVGSVDSHVHKPSEQNKERENDRNFTFSDKRIGGLSAVPNGMPVIKNNHQVSETKSFKHSPDLGRKIMDEERRAINQLPDKNVGAERTKDGVVKLAAMSGGYLQDSKERIKEKPALDGRMDGRAVIGDAKSSGSALVPNPTGVVQNRVGGVPRPVEKKFEQKLDGKEKIREKEGADRKGEKRKENDRVKPVLKDRDREKEKKKEEIVKATTEEKHMQVTRMKDSSENMLKPSVKDVNKHDISGVQSFGSNNITKDSNHHAATANNNLKKRKDSGLNGTYDELVTRPNKLARTASPHPLMENGRSLEPCQNSAAFAPVTQQPPMSFKVERNLPLDDTQRPPMKIKVDSKECKINGTAVEPCIKSSRETTAKSERKSAAPAKAPHPDIKYLGQVLSVPKMDEWSNFDDQEWLFNSNSSSTRKQDKSSEIDEAPQVWASALWLEPVDAYALPYVIPH